MSDRRSAGILIIALFFLSLIITLIGDRDLFFYWRVKTSKAFRDSQIAEIIKTLNFYNKVLIDFYASDGKPFLLNKFPGSIMLRHHTFRDIGFLQAHNRVIVYDMAEVIPVNIEITGPTTATAIVLERWNYIYQKRQDRSLVSSIKGMGRGFKYYMLRVVDHWIIQDYEPVDVEEPPIKEFRF